MMVDRKMMKVVMMIISREDELLIMLSRSVVTDDVLINKIKGGSQMAIGGRNISPKRRKSRARHES